jgi:hypothetical protein
LISLKLSLGCHGPLPQLLALSRFRPVRYRIAKQRRAVLIAVTAGALIARLFA